jgi:pyrroloquinoline quinone biosynthesis protein B
VDWHRVSTEAGSGFGVAGAPGLRFQALPLKSAAPPYSPHRNDPHPGDNIGVLIRDEAGGRSVFYAPGLAEIEPRVGAAMREADCVMVDGTFWTDDEMIRLGISGKRAREIGHLPQSGPGGMIEQLAAVPGPRKILIHINNTNPILDEDSPERARLAAAGIEVAWDGMRIEF